MAVEGVFKKLNLKDQTEIVVLDAPASFEAELRRLDGVTVKRKLSRSPAAFALAFVTTQGQVNALARDIAAGTTGDAVVWFAYPKGTSRRYKSELNAESRWAPLGAAGFEPVRMIAIDEDWTAVRFRRVEFIKTLTRDPAHIMTAEGRKRAAAPSRPAARRKSS